MEENLYDIVKDMRVLLKGLVAGLLFTDLVLLFVYILLALSMRH